MTRRPSTALAVVCSLSFLMIPAVVALADGPDTGASAPSARHYHRKPPSRYSRSAPSLPSRGVVNRVTGPSSVVGRLGLVVAENASIHSAGRGGRVLSVVPKGQNIAVSGETATDYAIVMIDHSLGYIAKTDVQLLDYQVVTTPPASGGSATGDSGPDGTPANIGPLGLRLVQTAREYLGVPYVWGGESREGIDCSGFVRAIYQSNGISLPRVSGDQAGVGYDVPHNVPAGDWRQWIPGDRMYFACHHPRIDHTGMYIGDGYFIHSSVGHNHQVAIDRVDNAYYAGHLVAVRRSKELLGESVASQPGASVQTSAAIQSDSESGQQ